MVAVLSPSSAGPYTPDMLMARGRPADGRTGLTELMCRDHLMTQACLVIGVAGRDCRSLARRRASGRVDDVDREELASFLRRRRHVEPADVGLRPVCGGDARVAARRGRLARRHVHRLLHAAGQSRGRIRPPSCDSLARALRLTDDERDYCPARRTLGAFGTAPTRT